MRESNGEVGACGKKRAMKATKRIMTGSLAIIAVVVAIALLVFNRPGPTDEASARPQVPNMSHSNRAAGNRRSSETNDERERRRDEVELKRSAGEPTSLSRTAATSIGPALQSDLELLGPDSDFNDAVRDFATELRDDDWAVATEALIWRAISALDGLTVADVQVQCKTTTCRIRIDNARFDMNSKYPNFGDFVWDLGLEVTWHWGGPDSLGNRSDFAYLRRAEAEQLRAETTQ